MVDENKEKPNTSLQANLSGEVSDVLGLGKGIEKLIDVLSRGVGAISRSFLIKRDADAKAYELKKLAEAIGDNQKLLGSVQYESGGLTLSAQGQAHALPPAATLEDRTLTRVAYQDAKRQLNVESVVQHAAEELRDKDDVSNEPINEDWIGRFFSIAENINSEQMQELWGKVLAGEIAKPGSYSLRTLDLIRNTTQEEAEIFVKVAQAAIKLGERAFIISFNNFNEVYGSEFGFRYIDVHKLSETGLLNETALRQPLMFSERVKQFIFVYGDKVLFIKSDTIPAEFSYSIIAFTTAGFQMLSLIEIKSKLSLIRQIASVAPKETFKVYQAELLGMENSYVIQHGELVQVEV